MKLTPLAEGLLVGVIYSAFAVVCVGLGYMLVDEVPE